MTFQMPTPLSLPENATTVAGLPLPEASRPAGYSALIVSCNLKVPPLTN